MENERLLRENRRITQQNVTLANKVICLEDNQHTFKRIIDKLRQDNQHLKSQIKKLKNKLQQSRLQIQEQAAHFDFTIRTIQQQLDEKNNQYEKLESKILPLFDEDTIRLKILNQIQYPHKLELEEKDITIETLKDNSFELRRQIETLKCKLQTLTIQHQKEIRELKFKYKNQIDNLRLDLQAQQTIEYERKSKQRIDSILKRDLEYYKSKYLKAEEEAHSSREILEAVKLDYQNKLDNILEELTLAREENHTLRKLN